MNFKFWMYFNIVMGIVNLLCYFALPHPWLPNLIIAPASFGAAYLNYKMINR